MKCLDHSIIVMNKDFACKAVRWWWQDLAASRAVPVPFERLRQGTSTSLPTGKRSNHRGGALACPALWCSCSTSTGMLCRIERMPISLYIGHWMILQKALLWSIYHRLKRLKVMQCPRQHYGRSTTSRRSIVHRLQNS